VLLAAACGCSAGADASAETWSPLTEAEQLSKPLASLVSAPCGAYAYAFRAERESSRELLAALRVARYEACATGVGSQHCDALNGLRPGPEDGAAAAWTPRVAALQALLHELCQKAATDVSRRDGHARGAATNFVAAAVRTLLLALACALTCATAKRLRARVRAAQVRSVAEQQMKLADARGEREARSYTHGSLALAHIL
jgi:hypothetical protein